MLDNERKEGFNGGVWDTVEMVFLLIIKALRSTACLRGIISIFASGQERLQFMDIKCVIFDFDISPIYEHSSAFQVSFIGAQSEKEPYPMVLTVTPIVSSVML